MCMESKNTQVFKVCSSAEVGQQRYSLCHVLLVLFLHLPSHRGLTASEAKNYWRFSGMWQTWFALCNFPVLSCLFSKCWKKVKVHHYKLMSLLRDYLRVVIKTENKDVSSWNRVLLAQARWNKPFCEVSPGSFDFRRNGMLKRRDLENDIEQLNQQQQEGMAGVHIISTSCALFQAFPSTNPILCWWGTIVNKGKLHIFFFLINTVTSERQLHIDETERARLKGLFSVQVHVLISQTWMICPFAQGVTLSTTVTLHTNQA